MQRRAWRNGDWIQKSYVYSILGVVCVCIATSATGSLELECGIALDASRQYEEQSITFPIRASLMLYNVHPVSFQRLF